MWIRSQNGEEILKVERFRLLPLDNGDCKVLAKLPRETVELGTYSTSQAEEIRRSIWMEIGLESGFQMPKRWEDEEE